MKRKMMTAVLLAGAISILAGCGGGGGGGPTTKAAAKVYLFGTMTSLSNRSISTVKATFVVPPAVMVNYSAATNAASGLCVFRTTNTVAGTCILRDTVITPSGPVLAASGDFSGSTYDINSRTLTISLVNSGSALKSNKTSNGGNGVEFATVNLGLATAGVLPAPLSVPIVPLTEQVGIATNTPFSLTYSSADSLKFTWSYL